MSDMQKFDDNIIKNLHMFSFKDDEQVYTNGVELVPLYRVVQILEHFKVQELVDKATPKKPKVVPEPYDNGITDDIRYIDLNYCDTCGSLLQTGKCCLNNDCRQAIDWSEDE